MVGKRLDSLAKRRPSLRSAALGLVALGLASAGGCGGTHQTYGAGAGGSAGAATGGSAGDGQTTTGGSSLSSGGTVVGRAGSLGSGGLPIGGRGGSGGGLGGSIPVAGTLSFAGTNTGGSAPSTSNIGRACVATVECDADGLTGLTCIRDDSTELDGGGPPRGLCTMPCSTHDTCWAVDPNSLCLDFTTSAYCVEGCMQGPATDPLLPVKCHNRLQFACAPLEAIDSGQVCTTSATCPTSAPACYQGTCVAVISGCLPACTGAQDCPAGTFCDREFGTCKPGSATGDPLGTECDPAAATDTCAGFCQSVTDVPNLTGMCTEICSFINPCSWEGAEPGGVCVFSTAINLEPEIGDLGFCSQFCDCNADCPTPGFGCVPIDAVEAAFGRPGLCLYPVDENGVAVETIPVCP